MSDPAHDIDAAFAHRYPPELVEWFPVVDLQ